MNYDHFSKAQNLRIEALGIAMQTPGDLIVNGNRILEFIKADDVNIEGVTLESATFTEDQVNAALDKAFDETFAKTDAVSMGKVEEIDGVLCVGGIPFAQALLNAAGDGVFFAERIEVTPEGLKAIGDEVIEIETIDESRGCLAVDQVDQIAETVGGIPKEVLEDRTEGIVTDETGLVAEYPVDGAYIAPAPVDDANRVAHGLADDRPVEQTVVSDEEVVKGLEQFRRNAAGEE